MTKRRLEIGQAVRARFITIPQAAEGRKRTIDDTCPIRDGTVTYIHPQNRFVCVATQRGITEAFKPFEIFTKEAEG